MTPEAGAAPPAIELIGIDKSFGSVHANKNVNLRVERGVIHGIVGENGAGKSTLMSILYGFYEADFGRNPRQWPAGAHPLVARGDRLRHRHGPPALHARAAAERARERHARRRGRRPACPGRERHPQAPRRARPGIWPRGRPGRDRRRAVGRPAAAGRNPEGAGARRRDSGARRADRGADAVRGRSAVFDAPGAQEPEQDDHLHHPQAARDHEPDRPRVGHAARRDGRDLRHRLDLAARTRRRHGRSQGDPQDRQGSGPSRQDRARGARSGRARRSRRRPRGRRIVRPARGRDPGRGGGGRQRPVGASRGARRHPAAELRARS